MNTADTRQLTTQDAQIFAQFADSVRQQFPDARIWAFGSRVKGTATVESDLDVCVVVSTLNEAIRKQIRHSAGEIGFDHNVVISTVAYSTEEFERGPCSQSSLVQNILTQGVSA